VKKIAIFINSLRGGGAERIVSYLIQKGYRRFDIHLILLHRDIVYDIPAESIQIVELEGPDKSKWSSVFGIPALSGKLKDYLEKNQIETLISLLNRPNLIACRAKKKGWKGKLIISERADTIAYYKTIRFGWYMVRLVRKFYPYADTVTAISKGIAQSLGKLGINQVKVIYNPVQLEALPGHKTNEHAFIFINVARLDPQKNHALLLRAFSKLNDPTARLIILGKGPLAADLEKLAAELGISKQVNFEGFQKDINRYLKQADCFVFSSDYEGLGNVIIEALAAGLPVISTDCPFGPREILSPSSPTGMIMKEGIEFAEYGVLTPIYRDDLLAEAMRRVKTDNQLRLQYAEKAVSRSMDFNIEKITEEYFSLF
jgi:N-acetylgalactosamine-N,N'-diacetylbacillosaminyl-diphospho-undecaprenol 4-alpha-N-acetylgalactosaminyltransferase